MKRAKTLILLALLVCLGLNAYELGVSESPPGKSSTLFSESFDDAFNFPPAGWITVDADGDGHNWKGAMASHTGSGGNASSDSRTPGPFGVTLDPDNWLISPKIDIPAGGIYRLVYWIGYSNPQFPAHTHGVLISTTDTDPDSFEEIHSEVNHNNPGSNYYEVMLSLEDYAGESIYIAFRHFDSYDIMGSMYLDDIVVEETPSYPVFVGAQTLNIGSVLDIRPDKQALYTVSNAGTQPLEISLESASPELTLNGLPLTVDPQSSETIEVLLDETTAQSYTGSFTLNTNDPDNVQVNVDVAADIQAAVVTGFYSANFESGMPNGWVGWGFSSNESGGINNSASLQAWLSGAMSSFVLTHYIEMGENPIVEFSYKLTNIEGGTPTPADQVAFSILVSDDYGDNYTEVYRVQPGEANEHIPSSEFQKLNIPLTDYAGKTCMIAVEAVAINQGDFTFDIDNMALGTRPDIDLSIMSVAGIPMPTVNTASVYSVIVENLGTISQTNYTVNLLLGSQVVATIQGEPITSGEIKTYELTWTPTETGAFNLYGEVVLSGDEDLSNNKTRGVAVNVQEEGTFVTNIGTGNGKAYFPVNMNWYESASQSLYYAHEFGVNTGTIEAIMYKTNFFESTMIDAPRVRLYIGETDKTDFTDKEWVDVSELTEVFDGKLRLPTGESEWKITFSTPYAYQGGNVVIYAVMTELPYMLTNNLFYNTNIVNSYRTASSVSINLGVITPENPGTIGSPASMMPNVAFFMRYENTGSVSGVVSDMNGVAIKGAKVELNDSQLYIITNDRGEYKFSHLSAGNHTLKASMFGYEDAIVTVTAIADQDTELDITMEPKQKVNISGTVTRADDGGPIEGVQIALLGIDNYYADTDSQGAFLLNGVLMNNNYEATVSGAGFIAMTTVLEVGDEDVVWDIVLDEIPRPVQLISAEITENIDAKVTWFKPNTVPEHEFRYDSGIQLGQLGFLQPLPKALMGAVHTTPAELYEMSWLCTDKNGNSHPLVDLYILDLDASGMPTSTVLYSAIGIDNTDNIWNTHTLATTIYAPNGFMLALGNAYGSVDLAYAMATDSYPFERNVNLYTEDYTTELYYKLDDTQWPSNFMIRATGIEIDGGKAGEQVEYSVYRFAEGQTEDDWTDLGQTSDTFYVDSSWSTLSPDIYYYAVKAHYAKYVSVPSVSNSLAKDMDVEITVNLTTNSGVPVQGAKLTLTNQDGNPDHIYTAVANAVSVFPEVRKGSYEVSVEFTGFETYREEIEFYSDTAIDIELKELITTPYGLKVEATLTPSSKLFSWNNEADIAFWDDVESYENFIIENIGSYTLIDGDGLPTWILAYTQTSAYTFPNNGYTGSYIVMNPSETLPAMTSVVPYSGNKVLACVAANRNAGGIGRNNDWLVLPELEITEDMVFRFQAKSAGKPGQYFLDRINIGVSTTGTDENDFIFLNGGDYLEVPADSWTEYSFDLSAYVGMSIHLAINCVSYEAYMLLLDDLYVGTDNSKQGGSRSFESYKVYLDNEEMGTTQNIYWEFTGLTEGNHQAGVKAVYTTGESEIVSKPFMVNLPYTVTFEVTDQNNLPITDATVKFNGEVLPGYIAEDVMAGTYTYTVSKEGYEEETDTVTVVDQNKTVKVILANSTGLEMFEQDYIRLYPNPFKDEIYINDPSAVKRVKIMDISGQIVKEALLNGNSIPTGELAVGTYLISLEMADGATVVRKLIKK